MIAVCPGVTTMTIMCVENKREQRRSFSVHNPTLLIVCLSIIIDNLYVIYYIQTKKKL